MKKNFLWWTVLGVCFLFTYYVDSNFVYFYPSVPFPNFGNEWKWGHIQGANISFYSPALKREISVTEIIRPHEERISFFATQLLNQEETQAATIAFIQNVWCEKYPDDTLIAKPLE